MHIVKTKDPGFRIFCYESFGPAKFSDEFKAWYAERDLSFIAMSRGLSEIPLTMDPKTFSFTDDLEDLPDNVLMTSTFYFGDPEIAMLFKLEWA